MLKFVKDPANHCMNANDSIVLAQSIDLAAVESALFASQTNTQLNQVKNEIMSTMKSFVAQPPVSPQRYNNHSSDQF